MRSFQHHYMTEGKATVTIWSTIDNASGCKGMRIEVSTEMPPNSITIEIPVVEEVILK